MVNDSLVGRTQTEIFLHHSHKNRLVSFWQNDLGQERIQGQPEVGNAILEFTQMINEAFDTTAFFRVVESQTLFLSQATQIVETELQPELVPHFRRDHFRHFLHIKR